MSEITVRFGKIPSSFIPGQINVFLLAVFLGFVGVASPAQGQTPPAGAPSTTTFTVHGFQTDLFTWAATSEIPIIVPPGTAGVAPKIVLLYNSSTIDEIDARHQGQYIGLGWTLDIGGFVFRDTKGTTGTGDDTFQVVFGGVSYDLVRVDATQNILHTKDETFWKLQYNSTGDYWTLTTKDGTTHRFGFNTDSKATALLYNDFATPVTWKYFLDEVTTTSGTSVRYSYVKQTGTYQGRIMTRPFIPMLSHMPTTVDPWLVLHARSASCAGRGLTGQTTVLYIM